ncbi:MAG: hypothetical protein K6C36_08750 [Clostridia bacterium]|nr:hypothetical protein [Clostridia bacterium]
MEKLRLKHVLLRETEFFDKASPAVPKELFSAVGVGAPPELSGLPEPLPSKKSEYTCFARTDAALWLGAPNGLTRIEPDAERAADTVMFFSANRHLEDDNVLAVYAPDPSTEKVWVLTDTAAQLVSLRETTAEEKAMRLTAETKRYVDRHGLVTQRDLKKARDPESRVPYGHSDNSGAFTAVYAIGELMKYACFRDKYGEDAPLTVEAKNSAVRAVEACQLLMNISCRGDGFVARTFITPAEPVPDDGLFYRIENGKAVCLETTEAKSLGVAGRVIPADAPVPKRLAHLYEDEGFTTDGMVYKGDTSSDELTPHFALIYFAHEILGKTDPELDEILKTSAKNTMSHIINNGYRLMECFGVTTWGRWNEEHFDTGIGWADAALKSAELLMYHRVTMAVTGEAGIFRQSYDRLTKERGYAELTTTHEERFRICAELLGEDVYEEMMYGDHMAATLAYWVLIALENDPRLRELYKEGFRGWNGTIRREHNPGYDFPYFLCCPEDGIDTEMLVDWFRRQNGSFLAASTAVESRNDVQIVTLRGGSKETGHLLMPDERAVSKFDRNPFAFYDRDGAGIRVIESCYVYTFSYWLGRYFGFIEEDLAPRASRRSSDLNGRVKKQRS